MIDDGAQSDDHADQPHDQGDDHGDQDAPEGGWLTIAEAATALGISTVSVRRRIRAGQLRARQVRTERGPAWRVRIAENGGGDHGDQEVTTVVDQGAHGSTTVIDHGDHHRDLRDGRGGHDRLESLVALLREREVRIDDLTKIAMERTEAATVWQARAEVLAERLAAAESRLLVLEAPKSVPDASGEAGSADPTTETPASSGTAWWRRWRAWLAAGLVVAVVGSASCSTSASVKHAALCTSARTTMDFVAQITSSGKLFDSDTWSAARDMVETAEKVC